MDVLTGDEIAAARLADWRKLAQGLHARYRVPDFSTGARFVTAIAEAGDVLGHHPRVSLSHTHVDLKLVSADAIYRDGEGTEHVVEWVSQQDVDLARRITEIAAGRGPNLWFGDTAENESWSQKFHPEVYVPLEAAEKRITAVLAAGGMVVDDTGAPSMTVIADQDGNRGVLCVAEQPADDVSGA